MRSLNVDFQLRNFTFLWTITSLDWWWLGVKCGRCSTKDSSPQIDHPIQWRVVIGTVSVGMSYKLYFFHCVNYISLCIVIWSNTVASGLWSVARSHPLLKLMCSKLSWKVKAHHVTIMWLSDFISLLDIHLYLSIERFLSVINAEAMHIQIWKFNAWTLSMHDWASGMISLPLLYISNMQTIRAIWFDAWPVRRQVADGEK